jgi:hypothetical protein
MQVLKVFVGCEAKILRNIDIALGLTSIINEALGKACKIVYGGTE